MELKDVKDKIDSYFENHSELEVTNDLLKHGCISKKNIQSVNNLIKDILIEKGISKEEFEITCKELFKEIYGY